MHRGPRLSVGRAFLAAVSSVILVGAGGLGTEGCRSPTQVTVELRTVGALPCTSLQGVAIVVARTPAEAEQRMTLESFSAVVARGACGADGHTIGTLVVTPQDSTGAIVVRARYRDDASATCTPPAYKGCIVSRRSFSFLDHVSATLPISLEVACVDVPCDVESSCRSGVCTASKADCSESGDCTSDAEPVLRPDGTPIGADGAVIDAPPTDGTPGDAIVDGPSEASVDATDAADASRGGPHGTSYGNDCPTSPATTHCTGATPVCCFMTFWKCAEPPGLGPGSCGGISETCNGRLDCAGQSFCCGPKQDAGDSFPQPSGCTTDVPGCLVNGDVICSTDDDCPDGYWCTGVRFVAPSPPGSQPVRKCTTTPP